MRNTFSSCARVQLNGRYARGRTGTSGRMRESQVLARALEAERRSATVKMPPRGSQ